MKQVAAAFLPLGYTSFGGPQAHIGMFQNQIVQRRKWIDEQMFLELFALGQFMPGPTSTQVAVALGACRAGYMGAAISYFLFQFPAFVVMTVAGLLSANYLTPQTLQNWWVKTIIMGITAQAIALIAMAAYSLGLKQCKTKVTQLLAILGAAAAIYGQKFPWSYPVILVIAGIVTICHAWYIRRSAKTLSSVPVSSATGGSDPKQEVNPVVTKIYIHTHWITGLAIIFCSVSVLVICIIVRKFYSARPFAIFEAFYRVGSIIYGGGQVVLPMLATEVVSTGWVSYDQFLAGFALQQALPGPLFNFSGYLGAISLGMQPDGSMDIGMGIAGALLAWVGLFAPGVLYMIGALPFWKKWRHIQVIRDALSGINAASIGLIVAAVFLLWTKGIYEAFTTSNNGFMAISIIGFGVCFYFSLPPPLAILGSAALGLLAWPMSALDLTISSEAVQSAYSRNLVS